MKYLLLLALAISLHANSDYEKCIGCHGGAGEKSALGKSKVIGGQDVDLTIKQLTGYKEGTLNQYGMGGLMKSQVQMFSPEQIKLLAEYIKGLK